MIRRVHRRRTSPWPGALMLVAAVGYIWVQAPPAVTQSPQERAAVEGSVTYAGCDEVRALGKAPIRAGEPGYREDMDGDGDGLACEPIHGAGGR